MLITDLSGDLTGLGWTILAAGAVLALLLLITCIFVIWAASIYIDTARGARHPATRDVGRRAARVRE